MFALLFRELVYPSLFELERGSAVRGNGSRTHDHVDEKGHVGVESRGNGQQSVVDRDEEGRTHGRGYLRTFFASFSFSIRQ